MILNFKNQSKCVIKGTQDALQYSGKWNKFFRNVKYISVNKMHNFNLFIFYKILIFFLDIYNEINFNIKFSNYIFLFIILLK